MQSMAENMRGILRGVRVDVSGIDRDMLLPNASYPIWMAIFHNLLLNASNAMLDSETKQIAVSSAMSGEDRDDPSSGHWSWLLTSTRRKAYSNHLIEAWRFLRSDAPSDMAGPDWD